ncbi:MAG TPA: hypothetical protein P5514_09155 [Bacteroidales bacterium]|nr:hypothetical protein [Bacteroidales bacterium]HPE56400.1 hypothetical protein [Bacteroidales bacterium]HRX97097.1 hypothetical protein [Bacteroidales bacterium]
MKTLFSLMLTLLFAGTLFAQEENKNPQEYKTLFGNQQMSNGAYGGLSINYTQIDKKDAMLVGARGAWIINHSLALGFGGYGFANDLKYEKVYGDDQTENYFLAGGYGGLLIEPIIAAKSPVHVSVPILIGAGGISYINTYWSDYDNRYDYAYTEDADAFFVIEPGIELELNLVKFMRVAFGGYYRYTSDVNLYNTKKDVLNGFSTGITFKFGKF